MIFVRGLWWWALCAAGAVAAGCAAAAGRASCPLAASQKLNAPASTATAAKPPRKAAQNGWRWAQPGRLPPGRLGGVVVVVVCMPVLPFSTRVGPVWDACPVTRPGWDVFGHVVGQLWRPVRRAMASRTGLLRGLVVMSTG